MIKVLFASADGSHTMANCPSLGLLYWYGHQLPRIKIENPEPFKVYVVGAPMPSNKSRLFLNLAIAAAERKWNKTPSLSGTHEEKCLQFLKWLHEDRKEITELILNPTEEDHLRYIKRMLKRLQ